MAEAAAIGISPDDFLGLTPRELRAQFSGAEKRFRMQARLAMFTAWHSGAFSRYPKKKALPLLQPILAKMGEQRDMSPRELRTALLGWHKQMGGAVRVVPKGSIRSR